MKQKIKVAIQGKLGSFHNIVVNRYFENDTSLVLCDSFDQTVKELLEENADLAVMAIENSIAGSIIPNYALIDQNNLKIIGEYGLNINHNLMGLDGQSIEEIDEVFSHPMALLQCKSFFNNYPHIKLIESEDTALFAKKIKDEEMLGVGAIASKDASEIYNLEILNESIQTIKNNKTRFVILEKKKTNDEFNKAALKFILDHKRGSLASVLNMMSDCSLNLTKIQSLPVIQTPGKYAFFVDITFNSVDNYNKAKKIIEIMAQEFKVLGEYKIKEL